MAKAVGIVLVLVLLYRVQQGSPAECAEWSFECPAEPAVAVRAEPVYAG